MTILKTKADTPGVKNKRFALLLRTLLSDEVRHVDVNSIGQLPQPLIFLDARENKEYKVSTISHAIHIGFEDFDITICHHIPVNSSIIVFCSVGVRSQKICSLLKQAGYTNVHNLYGGIFEWINRGLPVVDNKGGSIEEVHAFSRLWGVWVSGVKKQYG